MAGASVDRYSRQVLLPQIGESGQERIRSASALVVGCGALGSAISEILVRAGVGSIRVVDRDLVELVNLHRQILFDEKDADERIPKSEAAARRLREINSEVEVEGIVADVNPRNMEKLLIGVSIALDGTDNLETRYVLNDACVKQDIPWVYGGAVATDGLAMTVAPNRGPCLRCLFPEPPEPGAIPTCETAGVLATAPLITASIQATEALKLLVGDESGIGMLVSADAWSGRFTRAKVERRDDCPACGKREFSFLESKSTSWVTTLCGSNAIQITPSEEKPIDLPRMEEVLGRVGKTVFNGLILTFEIEGKEFDVFPDGRVIIKGTADVNEAKSLYAKYMG